MSSLGAVPGYGYPVFNYGESEFVSESGFFQVLGAPSTPVVTIANAGGGDALYVREIDTSVTTSAVVATRVVSIQALNAEGASVATYVGPQVLTAGQQAHNFFSVGIASAYIVQGNGFSPLSAIVIPPGWKWVFSLFGGQTGDTINGISVTGLKIPSVGVGYNEPAPIPTPVFA